MAKTFARNESDITVEDLREYPIWMDADWFQKEDLIERYGPAARRAYEPSRVAYLGSFPYPHLDGDDDHSPMVWVRSRCTVRSGTSFDGIAVPLLDRLYGLTLFVGDTTCSMHLGGKQFGSETHRHEILERYKLHLESCLGPLHEVFPAVVEIEEGLLPPEVTRIYTLGRIKGDATDFMRYEAKENSVYK